uniref:Uncharacterized protein n=1 Tax=Solanum lycopersicum TaxID=4081 RepID=A0A3Q7IFD8_SOLLC
MVLLSIPYSFPSFNNYISQRRSQSQSQRRYVKIGIRCGIAEPSGEPAPLGQKTKYNDGLFEKAFMTLFARKMENFGANKKESDQKKKGFFDYDYDSFVDVSRKVMQGRSRLQQQQVVRQVLMSMLPPGAPAQFRKLFPPTQWAAEFNAAITVPFFFWLVGPSEVFREQWMCRNVCEYVQNTNTRFLHKRIRTSLNNESKQVFFSFVVN